MRIITVYPPSSGLVHTALGQFYFIEFLLRSFSFVRVHISFPPRSPVTASPLLGTAFFSVGRRIWAPAQACASPARPHPQQDSPSCGTFARPYSRRPDDPEAQDNALHCRRSGAQYRRSDYLPRQLPLPLPHSLQLRQCARVSRPRIPRIPAILDP